MLGPYKRAYIEARQQAKYYLSRRAVAAVGRLPWRRGRRGCRGTQGLLPRHPHT